MTRASLMQVFTRHGLEQVNPINEKFDPNLHEALFQKVRLFQHIYIITNLLIRPLSIFAGGTRRSAQHSCGS